MVQCVHYGGAICAFNMHTQVKCEFMYQVTPSLTNMRELAPPEPVIPTILFIQSIAVDYAKEYITIEPIDTSVMQSLGGRRRQS